MLHVKKFLTHLFFWSSALTALAGDAGNLAIIPQPQTVERSIGNFELQPQTRIVTDSASQATADQLAAALRPATGWSLPVNLRPAASPVAGDILLTTHSADAALGPEGYDLTITTNEVVIRAPTPAGLFYGVQTLRQLLPPEIFSTNAVAGVNWQMPCVHIRDWPRFKWRGLMLDVSRHFYNVSEVKTLLDLMALHKLNTFHWHLVDSQGWRIEIEKYPLLTSEGAWRTNSELKHPLLKIPETFAHPDWTAPTADKFKDGRYGGFYTPADIRAVVAYAAARHITIVPEIEMPGHSTAALAAYPRFSGPGGTNDTAYSNAHYGIYDPANPETFTFLEDVLTEVFQLFPGPYVHIGGDEVQKDFWKHSPDCQALMKREGLKNEDELQSWFIKRIETFVNAHGKILVGWSEILQGGLAQNAVVMDWIGGGEKAARAGHDAVMTPTGFCYFNYYQSTNHTTEPRAQGGFIPLEKAYGFDPVPAGLPAPLQAHILGAQGNLWTEYIASLPHAEYMLFPRTCALAEVVWSAREARNWPDFQRRLQVQEQRLDALNVNYRRDPSAPVAAQHGSLRVTTDFIDAAISLNYPGFTGLSVDSLGKEHFPLVNLPPPFAAGTPVKATQHGSRVEYRGLKADETAPPAWAIEINTNEITLESHWSAADQPAPLIFSADTSRCHLTLLGLMQSDGAIQLPALLHLPDQGSFEISGSGINSLGYAAVPRNVKITFPPATRDHPVVTYRWQAVSIHPAIAGIKNDPHFDGFRRDWLNIFQLSPRWRMLANNSASDTCAFCYYEYADIARMTPPLAPGLTALDLVRQTLDRIIHGANGYGMPGHGSFPEYAADTLPSLLIAADDYVEGSGDQSWLVTNYWQLKAWSDHMLATDHDGNGLMEYSVSGNSGSWPLHIKYRPANWWDTIGFGHEDAYANALAYRALRGMEHLARQADQPADQARYQASADKLQAAYFKNFFDPATGVLAGWRSADGQLHDYYFPWVNGIAIHYDLVTREQGNAIMDHLLAKLKSADYTRFDLGLPGNLIPVARKDYVDHRLRFGGGARDDNSDGFQIYENGGATACFAYFTYAALYDLGRTEEADKMLLPLLDAFTQGDFQGPGDNKMTRDWKTWDGTCWGYEGFLTDNYYALLAVLDRAHTEKMQAIR
jgi:hexosaminidase